MPPAGYESDYRNADVVTQLRTWAKRDGRGKASGPSTEFILPTGAALSPDAAWVSNTLLSKVAKEKLRRFPPVCPVFVIEVMSPSDRLKTAQEKMRDWMAAGVKLGWLLDGDRKTVYVYRAGRKEPHKHTRIAKLAGEGPVAGFELDLTEIWAGL